MVVRCTDWLDLDPLIIVMRRLNKMSIVQKKKRERERVEKEELRATKMEFPISYCFIPVLVATKNIPSKNSLNPVINRHIVYGLAGRRGNDHGVGGGDACTST